MGKLMIPQLGWRWAMLCCCCLHCFVVATVGASGEEGIKRDEKTTLCLACVSYNRLGLLQTTLRAITAHLDSEEEDVRYRIAWVDNGSKDKKKLEAIEAEFPGMRKVWNAENKGLAWALNTLFFDLCSEPFVLTLEEDWGYYFEENHWYTDNGRKVHVYGSKMTSRPLSLAIEMMKHDRNTPIVMPLKGALMSHVEEANRPVLGVVLRPETFDGFLDKIEETLPLSYPNENKHGSVGKASQVKVYRYCMHPSSGYTWGSYTNGPSLYNRSRLLQIGRFYGTGEDELPDAYSEANYAFRAGRVYCLRVPQVRTLCKDASGCNAVFRHLGYGKSTNHSHRSKIDKERGLEWTVFGTELYDIVREQEKEL